jgi:hypothetical protein
VTDHHDHNLRLTFDRDRLVRPAAQHALPPGSPD